MKSISRGVFPNERRAKWSSGGTGLTLLLGLTVAVVTVGGVPTSVLTSAKETNAHHGSEVTQSHQAQLSRSSPSEDKYQISVPQKRGVNPLLYNDLDYSGNSIPHGGVWDDINGPPLASSSSAAARLPLAAIFPEPGSDSRMRNYDLLTSLLGAPPAQTFYGEPVTPSVNYPYGYGLGYGGDRSKRMISSVERNPSQSLRPKRSPSKLSPTDALSLLALLESRDPYPVMSDYFPLGPANGPNDVLPYSPNSVYQDIPLSLALAELGGGGDGVGGSLHASRNAAQMAPYSDNEGEWMNTWTEPAVDYLGFPIDVDTLSRLDHRDRKPSKNGFPHQKRFMITKKKRSVSFDNNDDCNKNENKKNCLLRKYGQLTAAKVATA